MAKRHFGDLTCKSTVYVTPELILEPTRKLFGGRIPLDPATEPAEALRYCTDSDTVNPQFSKTGIHLGDRLQLDWHGSEGTFVNLPYGKAIKTWCGKIHVEADQNGPVVALLPAGARFGTRYFQNHVFISSLNAACFIRGRVKFRRPDGSPTQGQNPYDSVLYFYNLDANRVAELYGHLGKVMRMEVL